MMRPDDNDESSPDLKMRMLEALASVVQFEVEGVYDDRKDVLQRFEELGIKTHQIKESSRNP
jgi:hypothetical protein